MMRIYKHSLEAERHSASTRMVLTARRLYIIFMMSYKEGEKSPDVNVGVLSAASALRECLEVVSRERNYW